ncbi:MAG: caspase family protein [Rubrivivax sp.]|nr:caspase family protein [Rubrivivax sp.]
MTKAWTNPTSLHRRRLLAAGSVAALGPWAGPFAQSQSQSQAQGGQAVTGRIALLIGNRDYPDNQDLPPMHTNVARVGAALQALGFQVTVLRDLSRDQSIQSAEAFGQQLRALPPDGTALFYFCGHGMQIDAENFLLPSGIYPRFRPLSESSRVYVALQKSVLEPWPARPAGQTITVIDACRSSPKKLADVAEDGLNQVRARDGEMIVFSTGAGKPALARTNPDHMTFFTEELVRQLDKQAQEPEELNFRELFQSVGNEVERTMRNHRLEDIRELAQVPNITDNVRVAVRVSPVPPKPRPTLPLSPEQAPPEDPAIEERAFAAIGDALWPATVARLVRSFLERYPNSRFRTAALVASDGANKSAGLLKLNAADLHPRDFQPRAELGAAYAEDLRRAARGDKDAAARVGARLLALDPKGLWNRYVGWMKFAVALGNGIAAYDLARYLEDNNLSGGGEFRTRAGELGYVIPPSLRKVR